MRGGIHQGAEKRRGGRDRESGAVKTSGGCDVASERKEGWNASQDAQDAGGAENTSLASGRNADGSDAGSVFADVRTMSRLACTVRWCFSYAPDLLYFQEQNGHFPGMIGRCSLDCGAPRPCRFDGKAMICQVLTTARVDPM